MAAAMLCVILGCHHSSSPVDQEPQRDAAIDLQIAALRSADVAADVAAAMRAKDARFVGIMGVGLVVPGIDPARQAHIEVRVIPNTSDCPGNPSAVELNGVTQEYARKYNERLWESLHAADATEASTSSATGSGLSP